jgi:predicted permease
MLAGSFDLGGALRDAGGRETGRASALRAAMSATQIALSLVLLVGAFLLVRTVGNLYAVDTGLSIERVAVLGLDLDDVPDEDRDAVHRRVIAAVRAVPGVDAAALDVYGPHAGASMGGWVRLPSAPDAERVRADLTFVGPGWFEVLGVELVSGRTFRSEDWEPSAPPRLVITAGLASRLFGTTSATGRRLVAGFTSRVEAEIVGVVEDVRLGDPDDPADPTFFQPHTDVPSSSLTVLARTRARDAGTHRGIREAVETAVPDLPVPDPMPLVDRLRERLREQSAFARMITLLGALAALLAAVGLYGVIAFTVAGRRRELGIRLALGADGQEIAGLVARYALGIVAFGTVAGLAAAYGLSRLLESRLFGVAPADPASYAGSALLFAAVAAVACWAPTRSAMRVDPVVTLRSE